MLKIKHENEKTEGHLFKKSFEVIESKPLDMQLKNNEISNTGEYSVKNEVENTYGVDEHYGISNTKEYLVKKEVRNTFRVYRKNDRLNIKKEIDYFNNCIFETEIEIIRHELFDAELNSEGEDLTPSFNCNKCQKSFKSKRRIKNHILSVHSLGNNINCKYVDTLKNRSKKNVYKICSFDSNVGRKRLTTKSNIIRHIAKSNSSCISMGNHPLQKNTKSYKCYDCDKSFRDQTSLELHMRVHTGEHPMCYICGKCFTLKSNLKIHERLHTGQKPYKCYVCEKSFTQSYDLTKHEGTHTGEKPYKCYICKKSFSRQSSLKRHEQIHTGGKRYKCYVCEKSFSRLYTLKLHQAKAHN